MNTQHSRDWTDEIHRSASWFCDMEDHPYQDFATEDELRSHIRAAHPGKFDQRREERVLKRNVVYVSRAPGVCFFCAFDAASDDPADATAQPAEQNAKTRLSTSKKAGKRLRFAGETGSDGSDEDQGSSPQVVTSQEDAKSPSHADQWWTAQIRLGTHIAGHLKSLAFRSLRYFDDVKDEGSEKGSERAAADLEGSEMLSSTQGQGDHYFELDKWDPTDNDNGPILAAPSNENIPKLTIQALHDLGAKLETIHDSPEDDNVQAATATATATVTVTAALGNSTETTSVEAQMPSQSTMHVKIAAGRRGPSAAGCGGAENNLVIAIDFGTAYTA